MTTYLEYRERPFLPDDVANVVDRLANDLTEDAPRAARAADFFAGSGSFGFVLRQLGLWNDMERLAEVCLDFGIRVGDPRLVGNCAIRLLGTVNRDRQGPSGSKPYLRTARRMLKQTGDEWLRAQILEEDAEVNRRNGELERALRAREKSVAIFRSLADPEDLAHSLQRLAGLKIDIACELLGVDKERPLATDPDGRTSEGFAEAQQHLNEAAGLFADLPSNSPSCKFEPIANDAWQAVMARVQGTPESLQQAADTFTTCEDEFQSRMSLSHLYGEWSLVEHLLGDRARAHELDDLGREVRDSLGVDNRRKIYNCDQIVEHLKKVGLW